MLQDDTSRIDQLERRLREVSEQAKAKELAHSGVQKQLAALQAENDTLRKQTQQAQVVIHDLTEKYRVLEENFQANLKQRLDEELRREKALEVYMPQSKTPESTSRLLTTGFGVESEIDTFAANHICAAYAHIDWTSGDDEAWCNANLAADTGDVAGSAAQENGALTQSILEAQSIMTKESLEVDADVKDKSSRIGRRRHRDQPASSDTRMSRRRQRQRPASADPAKRRRRGQHLRKLGESRRVTQQKFLSWYSEAVEEFLARKKAKVESASQHPSTPKEQTPSRNKGRTKKKKKKRSAKKHSSRWKQRQQNHFEDWYHALMTHENMKREYQAMKAAKSAGLTTAVQRQPGQVFDYEAFDIWYNGTMKAEREKRRRQHEYEKSPQAFNAKHGFWGPIPDSQKPHSFDADHFDQWYSEIVEDWQKHLSGTWRRDGVLETATSSEET